MKKYAFWLLLLLPIYAAIVVRCTPSLHPIFRSEDLILDPALVGIWQKENSTDTWAIVESADYENAYVSTYMYYGEQSSETGNFLTRLAAVGETKFIDLYPLPGEASYYDLSLNAMLGIHWFAVVDQIEPDLIIRSMDGDWLDRYLKANPDALEHERVFDESQGGKVVLSASTEELQVFMIEHLDTPGAYGVPEIYHRIGDPPAPAETPDNAVEHPHRNPYRR